LFEAVTPDFCYRWLGRFRTSLATPAGALSRLKNWKILRDCRLKGDGVHQAMLGVARLHNLALTS